MAAPSSTVTAQTPPSSSTTTGVGVVIYVEEVVVGGAALLQAVPVVGEVCTMFLAFKALVDTARSNQDDLRNLQDVCDVVIKGVLGQRSGSLDPLKQGFEKLEHQVKKAEEIAKLCSGTRIRDRLKQCLLAGKISKDITPVQTNVNQLVGANILATVVEINDQVRVTRLVKVPAEAPRIRDWYVGREAVVSEACSRLTIASSTSDSSDEPRMVGLAGPGGVGKSTVASMVVAREDVRGSFHKGVLWLQVGQEAKRRLPDLMIRLAYMVYETVMLKKCRQPRKADLSNDPEDGAAYIQEVVDSNSRRFLVVADDVWEAEVLGELERAGVWVLYTSRQNDLLPDAALRLDQVLKGEAEMVLRRAADLADDARLPEAAYDLMTRCNFVVLDLALVGSWGVVRDRNDEKAWRAALNRIVKAQEGGESGQLLTWRAAVLHAGLEELAWENKKLYLALAILPKGLAFSPKVAGVILYGDRCSVQDMKAAERVLETLERWSILTLEDGGKYLVHDEHTNFIQGRLLKNQEMRDTVLPRWREYISSAGALVAYSSFWLVKIWDEFVVRVGGEDVPPRLYDAALDAMDPSSAEFSKALRKVARFHGQRKDWENAYSKYDQLLRIQEKSGSVDHLDVARTLYNLGSSAGEAGRTEEAEGYFRRALPIQEKKLGVHHPDVARTLHSLGFAAGEAGRTEEAMRYYRRALAIREKKLGVDHLDVAATLHRLGNRAGEAGRTEEAMGCYRRALAIREKKLGVEHPDVANILHNLGNRAGQTGRTEEAMGYFRRALAIREKKLGVDHPDVAATLHGLGACAREAGRTEEAMGYYRRALAIREKKLGVDHPDVAATLHGLGVCAGQAGRTEEAMGYFRRALAIREKKLGVDHPGVARTLQGLGTCVRKLGQKEEAEELFRRASVIQEKTLGAEHPSAVKHGAR